MGDDNVKNVKKAETMSPEKIEQSVLQELKQQRLKIYRSKIEEVVKKEQDALKVVEGIREEKMQIFSEFNANL